VGFALARPTTSAEENAAAISYPFSFWPVGWLSVFELCLCPFSRLYLPRCSSFLDKINCRVVMGVLSRPNAVTANFLSIPFQRFSLA
jgi:hypothetical protein